MLEIGRVTILKEGLSIEGSFSTAPRGKESVMPVRPGTEIPFDQSIRVVSGSDQRLYVSGIRSRNGIGVSHVHDALVTQPDSPLALPPYKKYETNEITFGHQPGESNTFECGQPEAGIRVEYLGHPMRDALEPVMFGAEREATTDSEKVLFEDHTEKKTLLFQGETTSTRSSGLETGDFHAYTGMPEKAYSGDISGDMMIGAYVSQYRHTEGGLSHDGPEIKVFAAVKPESDGILRVKGHATTGVNLSGKLGRTDQGLSRMVDELAAVSVFSREISDPAYAALRENFPLPFIEYVAYDLRIRLNSGKPGDWYKELTKNSGFDWNTIRNELPVGKVAEETQRIAEVLNVTYEKAPLPVVKKTGRGRGPNRHRYSSY